MNRILCTFVTASVLVSGAAFGQSKPKTTHDKQPLRDSQMDGVTAAGEENSAIAANNSTVTENNTATSDISGSVLEGAKGVNIVTSVDGLVANGVNVYDSSLAADNSTDGTDVKQKNTVSQDSSSSATLEGYYRGANSQLTVNKSSDVTSSNNDTSSINASLNHTASDTTAYSNTSSTTDTKSNSLTNSVNNAQEASASKSFAASESSAASVNTTKSSGTTNAFTEGGERVERNDQQLRSQLEQIEWDDERCCDQRKPVDWNHERSCCK